MQGGQIIGDKFPNVLQLHNVFTPLHRSFIQHRPPALSSTSVPTPLSMNFFATPSHPLDASRCNALYPAPSFVPMPTPLSKSNAPTHSCPSNSATWRGVHP